MNLHSSIHFSEVYAKRERYRVNHRSKVEKYETVKGRMKI